MHCLVHLWTNANKLGKVSQLSLHGVSNLVHCHLFYNHNAREVICRPNAVHTEQPELDGKENQCWYLLGVRAFYIWK
jgi:hypothetical protein